MRTSPKVSANSLRLQDGFPDIDALLGVVVMLGKWNVKRHADFTHPHSRSAESHDGRETDRSKVGSIRFGRSLGDGHAASLSDG